MTTASDLDRAAKQFRDVIDQHLPQPSPMIEISPDHTVVGHELMWGGIWRQPGLTDQLRSYATITAQCVNGWDFGLRHQIRVGMTLGIPPQKIKSLFCELEFYVGVPASVFALLRAQEIIDERPEWQELDVPLDVEWLDSMDEKLDRGRRLRRELWGAAADEQLAQTITHRLVPASAEIVDAYLYGEVWNRSPLEPRERMVAVLAALMCRGHSTQFRRHVRYALEMGLSQTEICEVIAQAGWYRGWPFVEDTLTIAAEEFGS